MTRTHHRWFGLIALALLLVAGGPVAAADDRPISMSEIKRMVDADQTPKQILTAMVDRGVGFRVSKSSERRLEQWGFDASQIELVKKIAAGEKVDLDAQPEAGEPDADQADGEPADDAEQYPVGYPNPEQWHKAEQARIERAVQAAGLGYKRIEFSRFTLYCHNKRVNQLVPMLRKLEADLIKRFPGSVSNASSKQSAHIVIVDGASEWRNWVDACFDSYEQDRIHYRFGPEDDPRPQLLAGSGYFLPACSATHADKMQSDEAVARNAAYAVGHLMMGQAGGTNQPDGLQTGFGDLSEAMAHRTPSVMVYSYEKRELGAEQSWKQMVLRRFKDKKVQSPADPWAFETSSMKPEDYALAWSFVSTLAEDPAKFAEAVTAVRNKELNMGEAVSKVYGLSDRKMLEVWYRFVSR